MEHTQNCCCLIWRKIYLFFLNKYQYWPQTLSKFSILTPQCYWIDTKSCWYGTLAGTEASEDGDTPVCHPLTSDPTLSSPLLRPRLPPHLLPPSAPVAVLASGYDLFRSSPGSRVQTKGGGCCVQVLSVCSAHFQCRAELS